MGSTKNRAKRALLAVGVGLGSMGLSAVPAHAATAPVVQHLADVNLQLGMTQRVTATVTGATSYEWRMWSSSTGWIHWTSGGAGYNSIRLTGDAIRHMNLVEVIAGNAVGKTTSNLARIRVWGISSSYPAAAGTKVRTGGWEISLTQSVYEYSPTTGMQAQATVTKLADPAAEPWMATAISYVDNTGASHPSFGRPCSSAFYGRTSLEDVTALGANQTATGLLCAPNVTEVGSTGGRWTVQAKATSTSAVGPTAWFRGA